MSSVGGGRDVTPSMLDPGGEADLHQLPMRAEPRRSASRRYRTLLVIAIVVLGMSLAFFVGRASRPSTVAIPTLRGLTLTDALTRLDDRGLCADAITFAGSGQERTVTGQDPGPGMEVVPATVKIGLRVKGDVRKRASLRHVPGTCGDLGVETASG